MSNGTAYIQIEWRRVKWLSVMIGLRQLARVGALIANTTFGTPCKLKHSDIILIEKYQNWYS